MKKILYLILPFLLVAMIGCEREVEIPSSTNPPIIRLTADTVATPNEIYVLTAAGQSAYGGAQLSKVEFYKGEQKLGEKTMAPYTFEYTVVETVPGEQVSFHAVLIDQAGNRVTSSAVKARIKAPRIRVEAENSILRGVAKVANDQATRETSSNQAKVGAIDNGDSGIDKEIEIFVAGDYVIRVAAGTGFNSTSHRVYIDDKVAEAKIYNIPNRGWNTWQTFDLVFPLEVGTRKISIRHNTGYGELDYFEYSER